MCIVSIGIVAAVLTFWLCAGGSAQAKPITLTYNTNSLNVMLPLLVAQELGFFTAEGFEVTPVYVRSGPTAMAAMVSGSADYSIVGSTTVVQAIARGIPAVRRSGNKGGKTSNSDSAEKPGCKFRSVGGRSSASDDFHGSGP